MKEEQEKRNRSASRKRAAEKSPASVDPRNSKTHNQENRNASSFAFSYDEATGKSLPASINATSTPSERPKRYTEHSINTENDSQQEENEIGESTQESTNMDCDDDVFTRILSRNQQRKENKQKTNTTSTRGRASTSRMPPRKCQEEQKKEHTFSLRTEKIFDEQLKRPAFFSIYIQNRVTQEKLKEIRDINGTFTVVLTDSAEANRLLELVDKEEPKRVILYPTYNSKDKLYPLVICGASPLLEEGDFLEYEGIVAAGKIKKKNGDFFGKWKIDLESEELRDKFLSEGFRMGYMFYETESYLKAPRILQCYRCQGYNHHQRTCGKTQKCMYCSGEHRSKECPHKQDKERWKCGNCKQAHPANSTKCPARQQFIQLNPLPHAYEDYIIHRRTGAKNMPKTNTSAPLSTNVNGEKQGPLLVHSAQRQNPWFPTQRCETLSTMQYIVNENGQAKEPESHLTGMPLGTGGSVWSQQAESAALTAVEGARGIRSYPKDTEDHTGSQQNKTGTAMEEIDRNLLNLVRMYKGSQDCSLQALIQFFCLALPKILALQVPCRCQTVHG